MRSSYKLIISLVIIISMMIALIACQQDEPVDDDETDVDVTDTTNNDDEPEPTGEYGERVDITLAQVAAIEGYDYTAGDELAKFYSDKFNYNLDVTSLSWEGWNETVRVWINAGDMPDVVVYNYNHPDAASFVDQELLKQLPDDWKLRWPNLAEAHDVSSLGPELEETFGGTYFLPRPRFVHNLPGIPVPNHKSLFVRKDWAKAVDYPVKTTYTISEAIELAQLISDEDPDELGDSLIPFAVGPITGTECFVLSNSTHYDSYYKDDDGEYKWGASSEETLYGLEKYKEAYDAGLLPDEFYTQTMDQERDQFEIQGIAGLAFASAPTGHLQESYQNFEKNLDKDPFESLTYATLLGDDGYFHQQDLINYWGAIVFSPEIEEIKLERFLDLMDYNSTPEGHAILNLGIEGEDWAMDEDGNYESLLPEGQALAGTDGKYPSRSYTLGAMILFDDFAFEDPNVYQDLREHSWTMYTERVEISTPETFTLTDWDLFKHDSTSMRQAQFDYNSEFSGLVTMGGNLRDNWESWINERMPVVQPVLDELNELYGG